MPLFYCVHILLFDLSAFSPDQDLLRLAGHLLELLVCYGHCLKHTLMPGWYQGTPTRTILRESGGKPKPRDEAVKQFQATLAATTQPAAPLAKQPRTPTPGSPAASTVTSGWRTIEHTLVYQTAFDLASTLPQAASSKRPEVNYSSAHIASA